MPYSKFINTNNKTAKCFASLYRFKRATYWETDTEKKK